MKKIKIQTLLMIILLYKASSLQCMFLAVKRWTTMRGLPATSSVPRITSARLAVRRQGSFPSLAQHEVSQITSGSAEKPSPFGPGGQRRSFSTTPVQKTSFIERVASFFSSASPEEKFIDELSEVMSTSYASKEFLGGSIKINKSKSGGYFSKDDCARAKKIIGQNKNLINTPVKSYYYVGEGQTLPRGIKINQSDSPIYHENALDIVMRNWFSFIKKDYTPYLPYDSSTVEQIMNYLDLAKYIVDNGGKLRLLKEYQGVYFDILMPYFRRLNGGDSQAIDFYPGSSYEEEQTKIMQNMFDGLDYIFEKLSDDTYKNYIRKAKKERELIAQDPNAYRKKVYESASSDIKKERDRIYKEKYLTAKRKRKEVLWRHAHKMWNIEEDYRIPQSVRQEWANVDFIEDEYVQWLKNPMGFINFHYGFRHSYKSKADAEREEQQRKSKEQKEILRHKGEHIWKVLSKYGLTATSSQQQIKSAYHKFAKEYRPDLPTKDTAKLQYIQEVNAAWDAYNEQLQREQTIKE